MARRFNRRPLTDAERDARRQADRERIEQAARALLTTDGWQRWIRVRASNGLSRYSLGNQMLIAIECYARGITPTYIAGFRAFLDLNRCVRKGEKAIQILAPVAVKQRDDAWRGDRREAGLLPHRPGLRRLDDRPAARQGARPAHAAVAADRRRQPPPPDRPAADSSRRELGYRVEIRDLPDDGPGGWCDPKRRQIVVATGPANRQVRTLVHELAHAHGVGYEPVRARAGRGARRLRHLLRLLARSASTSAASRSPTSPAGAKTARSTRSASTPQTIDTIAQPVLSTARCHATGRSSRRSHSQGYASASYARSTASTSISPAESCAFLTRRPPRVCGVSTSTTTSKMNSPRTRPHAAATWQPSTPRVLNARGKRWTRNAIAQHVLPPAQKEANRQRAEAGLPAIREQVTPHTLRYTCIASLFAAGADQDYVAAQVGHDDVTTTSRIYRYVLQRRKRGEIGRRRQLAMRQSTVEIGRALVHAEGR